MSGVEIGTLRRTSESGSMTVIAAAVIVIGLVLSVVVLNVGGYLGELSHASAAADAAALAAADELALGHGALAAWLAGGLAAAENNAELVTCECIGNEAKVEIVMKSRFRIVGRIHARARATVELSSA